MKENLLGHIFTLPPSLPTAAMDKTLMPDYSYVLRETSDLKLDVCVQRHKYAAGQSVSDVAFEGEMERFRAAFGMGEVFKSDACLTAREGFWIGVDRRKEPKAVLKYQLSGKCVTVGEISQPMRKGEYVFVSVQTPYNKNESLNLELFETTASWDTALAALWSARHATGLLDKV